MTASIRRVIRLSILAAIACATLEVCARVDDLATDGVPLWAPTMSASSLYRYEGNTLRGIPNAHYQKWHMNGLGFRGPDLAAGRTTIVCLGASETFGQREDPDDEYPRVLERQLNDAGAQRYQVVNAALPGMSIETIAASLPRVVALVHPRYAFVYAPPVASIWDAEPVKPKSSGSGPSVADDAVAPDEGSSKLRIAGRIRELLKSTLPAGVQRWLRERDIARALRAAGHPGRDSVSAANVAAYRAHLQRVVDLLEAAHVAPILVTHANRFGWDGRYADTDALIAWRKFYPLITQRGLLDGEARFNAVTRDIARERGLPLVDAARQIDPGPANFSDFVHFTDAGSARMAQLMSAEFRIAESGAAANPSIRVLGVRNR